MNTLILSPSDSSGGLPGQKWTFCCRSGWIRIGRGKEKSHGLTTIGHQPAGHHSAFSRWLRDDLGDWDGTSLVALPIALLAS